MVRRLTLVPSLVFAACASPTGNDVLLSSLASSARCEQPPVWHAPNDRTHPTRTGHSAVPLAGTPFAVAVSDKGVVYVTQAHAGSAARADLPATQFSASFPVGDLPSQVRIHPNGKTAYVSDQDARTITYVDVASNQAVATVALPAGSIPHAAMNRPDAGHDLAQQRGERRQLPFGPSAENSARTCGRSAMATDSSSPPIETSSMALRIPSLEENSRYTVVGGVSERSLIASMVVAA